MKIAILLPLKESFSKTGAGAVSILVRDHHKNSSYKTATGIFGSHVENPIEKKNFYPISHNKHIFRNKSYVYSFSRLVSKKVEIIELHNRPKYFFYLKKKFPKKKFILYFHNNPNELLGSETRKEKEYIYKHCDKIFFLSNWIKEQFFKDLKIASDTNFDVFYPGVQKISVFPKNKKNIILFSGKLNESKGYNIFIEAASRFISNNKNWKAIAIGSESRRSIQKNNNITEVGQISNSRVLKMMSESKIAVANSTWEEPMGRLPIEAASRGAFPIVSKSGGLTETLSDDFSILKENTSEILYKKLQYLKNNPKKLLGLQKKVFNNFTLSVKITCKKLDQTREGLLSNFKDKKINKKLKILHVASFNENSNGDLYYSTSNKINNGFIKLNHHVHSLDDKQFFRDTFLNKSKSLNKKILTIVRNLNPDLLLLGHTDKIKKDTIKLIKIINPNIKIARWYIDSVSPEFLKKNKKILFNNYNLVDKIFLTSLPRSNLRKYKHKMHFIPNPVDKSIECYKNFSNKNFDYDIFFALSHGQHRRIMKRGKTDERDVIIDYLNNNLPLLKKYFISTNQKNPKWGAEYYHYIRRSKMGLNISRGNIQDLYSSDRIASLIGNGLLCFVDVKTNFNKIFKNNELVFYKNKLDLLKKINFFKNNPKISNLYAKRAWLRYHRDFNSKKICDFILSKLDLSHSKNFTWEKF